MIKKEFLETIKILDGQPFNITYHELRSGINNIASYINPPSLGLYKCRLVYSKDKIDVTYHRYKKKKINSLKLIYDNDIVYSKKSTDREDIDKLFALRDFCDDILIVKNDLLTDTSIANIALFKNGIWYTPKLPLLKGTTRMRLIDNGFLKEIDIKVSEIKSYSKMALLNAMINFDIIADKNIEEIIKC